MAIADVPVVQGTRRGSKSTSALLALEPKVLVDELVEAVAIESRAAEKELGHTTGIAPVPALTGKLHLVRDRGEEAKGRVRSTPREDLS